MAPDASVEIPEPDPADPRLTRLRGRLLELGSVLVAFSGGADSAFLLAAAARYLPAGTVAAATAVSGSLALGEAARARQFASSVGVAWLPTPTNELERPGYRANAGDRCFHCKSELLERLLPVATRHGLAHVATGTNADDAVAGFRPGIAAAARLGAVTPLLDAGLTKADVRELSRAWRLPTWDKPAAACLSSRIAYGVTITPARLATVDRAERAVREWLSETGRHSVDLRVRDLGSGRARVEVDAALVQALDAPARVALVTVVSAVGFSTVDVEGFRSGSMNELLDDPDAWRRAVPHGDPPGRSASGPSCPGG